MSFDANGACNNEVPVRMYFNDHIFLPLSGILEICGSFNRHSTFLNGRQLDFFLSSSFPLQSMVNLPETYGAVLLGGFIATMCVTPHISTLSPVDDPCQQIIWGHIGTGVWLCEAILL
jgi:hypothetical protein